MDIGDLVANAVVGSRFGMSLAWVVVVGIIGICVFAEMSGRIAAVSQRPVFDLVRERMGPRAGLVNLGASFFINVLTLAAEIGGAALALELATGLNYLLWVPPVALVAWLVMWRVKFETMERVFGLAGLALVVFIVALWQLGPDWGELTTQLVQSPQDEGVPTYLYYAIALLGGAMTPYEVFFFSSGGVEERWTRKDLVTSRANVFAALSSGYSLSQYFGWQWGKYVVPGRAARFHVTVLASVIVATALILTTIDPIKVTEYSLVFSARGPSAHLPAGSSDRQRSRLHGGEGHRQIQQRAGKFLHGAASRRGGRGHPPDARDQGGAVTARYEEARGGMSEPARVLYRIEMSVVTEIGSAVRVAGHRQDLALERWLTRNVVSRIPGAAGTEDQDAPERMLRVREKWEDRPDSMRLGGLLGPTVRDPSGEVAGGTVDVRLVQDGPLLAEVQQAFRLAGLLIARRRAGSSSGTSAAPGCGGRRCSAPSCGACTARSGTPSGARSRHSTTRRSGWGSPGTGCARRPTSERSPSHGG
ncbi:NRAMP family divalent metal transporter [Microbispora siamensis]